MLLLLALVALAPAEAAPPSFSGDTDISTDTGHVLVQWQSDEPVTLSITDRNGERPLYAGTDQSYFLSGLSNGDYELHLKGKSGVSARPVTLSVAHQSLTQALWLTLVGFIITAAIIVTILKGARDD